MSKEINDADTCGARDLSGAKCGGSIVQTGNLASCERCGAMVRRAPSAPIAYVRLFSADSEASR